MYCKSCGCELNEGQKVCIKCGVEVGNGKTYCAYCGQPVNENAAVCLNCGCSTKSANNSDSVGGKDKLTIALVCFFLGGLGIHNFMLGETKKGIFRIALSFCFGIGAIIALIDFIKILTDKYEVNPDKFF